MTYSREEKNAWQREYRKKTHNIQTKLYEKTPKGFLMRLYRNMKSRVTGVQKDKFHLYANKDLLDKDVFTEWALASEDFWKLFKEYAVSGYLRKLAPSVDRIDSKIGYMIGNMEWVTHSENSRRGSLSRHAKTLRDS